MSIYTRSERTVKKYTVYQATESARRRLNQVKGFKGSICVNALRGRSDSDKITLEELNSLSDSIVDDTMYHEGIW